MNTSETPVVLITGANRGIGLAIARGLAQRRAHVVLAARSAEKARQAAEELSRDGLTAQPEALDVTDAASVNRLVGRLHEWPGRLDALVNNAGIFEKEDGSVLEVDPAVVRRTFEVNCIGALRVTQAMVPLLRRRPDARVINMSSGLGQMSEMGGGYTGYRISKAALGALTLILDAELVPFGVKVNAMCPGWVRTAMGGPEAPLTPEQGADTAVWLALDAPADLHGKMFRHRQEVPW